MAVARRESASVLRSSDHIPSAIGNENVELSLSLCHPFLPFFSCLLAARHSLHVETVTRSAPNLNGLANESGTDTNNDALVSSSSTMASISNNQVWIFCGWYWFDLFMYLSISRLMAFSEENEKYHFQWHESLLKRPTRDKKAMNSSWKLTQNRTYGNPKKSRLSIFFCRHPQAYLLF